MVTELDVDIQESDSAQRSPIHSAIMRGNVAMVKCLHALGCDFHAATSTGSSPLFSAVCHKMYNKGITHPNNLELTKLLLSWGVSPAVCTNTGWTLLSGAVEKEDIAMTQYLLTLPSFDINIPTGDGSAPLFRVVNKGNLPLVQLLFRHGADIK
jgi:ankyrin repeat protein